MYFHREISQFPELLLTWRRRLHEVGLPESLDRLAALDPLVDQVERRYREGPDAPLRLALFGPTGGGKSKLFSSLVGHAISPSGFRRPYTRRAFFYLHRSREAMKPTLRGEVVLHDDAKWRDVLLIDTPDFDSVESKNREEAERVFLDADAFLFVTDVQKYADAATWTYLERIFSEDKPCCVILNKLRSNAPLHDLARRLEDRFGERGRDALEISVPELAIDDETILPDDTPALGVLREIISRLVSSQTEAREILRDAFRVELERLFRELRSLHEAAQACDRAQREATRAVNERYRAARERVSGLLDIDLAEVLTDQVYASRLEAFERIDRLRPLRRIVETPWIAFRNAIRPTGKIATAESAPLDDAVRVANVSENFPVLEGAALAAADDAREAIVAEGQFRDALDARAFSDLRLRHDELRKRYERVVDELREFALASAREAGAALPRNLRRMFFGLQIAIDAILLALVLESAMSWPFAVVLLAILFPLVAKGTALAVNHQQVSYFSASVRAEHQRLATEVLDEARDRFDGLLSKQTEGLSDLIALLDEIQPYFDRVDDIVESFARKRYEVDFRAVEEEDDEVSGAAASGSGATVEAS